MVAVGASGAQLGYGAVGRGRGRPFTTWSRLAFWLTPQLGWLEALGLFSLAGGALLVTLVLLGRPPVSVPTFTGLRTFFAVAAMGLGISVLETAALARITGRRFVALRPQTPPALAPTPARTPPPAVPDARSQPSRTSDAPPADTAAPPAATPALMVRTRPASSVAARAELAGWCWRKRYWVAGAVYAGAALCAKPSLWHIDLPGWFVPATKLVLAGRPLEMYAIRADVMGTASPLEHGPLGIVLYAPLVALAELAGKTDFLRMGALFPLLGVLVADCLMAYQATRAVKDLAPRIDEQRLFGVFALILFSPLLWFSSVWLVHLESLNALLVIGAMRLLSRNRGGQAGLCLGAALLLKHSAALAVGPLLLAFFILGRYGLAVRAGVVAAGLALAGLAPFALATPEHFAYNFFGYDSIKPIYGLTIWKAAYESGLEPLIMRLDSVLVTVVALGSAVGVSLYLRKRAADVRLVAWVAIVLGQLAWLGLATWQYPHYFVLCFVGLLVWETGTRPGWPIAALLFLFVPYNLQSHFPSNVGKAGGRVRGGAGGGAGRVPVWVRGGGVGARGGRRCWPN